jgi:nucleoside-diphosphate-sugar epimerase
MTGPASLHSQRVAVTGAAGFTGLHLLRRLHQEGASILAMVVKGSPTAALDSLPFPVERVIVEDVDSLGRVIRQTAPNYVVHLSAYISTERSWGSLEATIRWNLLSTISVLTACAEAKVARVLMMGSTEEYGQNSPPYRTTDSTDPLSPYAASKAAATCYARMFHHSFHLSTVVLRPSVVYGPGQSQRMLIPMVMRALAQDRSIDVTEGIQTRDFVYIADVVDAIVVALTVPGAGGSIWNIGSGQVVTVRHCLERIEAITGKSGLIQYGKRPYKPLELFHYHPEVEEAYTALNWRPSVMLDEGLRKTWQATVESIDAPAPKETKKPMKISVGFTAYNEQDLIETTLTDAVRDLDALNLDYEILVIDNASTDRTAAISDAFALAHPRVRVLRHPRNLGYAHSNLTAYQNATGDLIAVVDSDGQQTLRDIPKFIEKIQGGADVVFGWRKVRNDPAFRKIISAGLNRSAKKMLRWKLHDINCGFRVVTAEVARSFTSVIPVNYFGPELWVHSVLKGYVVDEVVTEHFERKGGTSIHIPWKLPKTIRNAYAYLDILKGRLDERNL